MGAREVLRDLTGAGFSVEVAGDRLLVGPASKLTDDLRAAVRAAKPDLLALLNRPHKLTLAEGDAAHAEPWDEAGALHLRDAQGDDRALCVECRHLAGHGSSAWRCGNADVAGIGRDLPDALVTQPQRCPGFRDAVR